MAEIALPAQKPSPRLETPTPPPYPPSQSSSAADLPSKVVESSPAVHIGSVDHLCLGARETILSDSEDP